MKNVCISPFFFLIIVLCIPFNSLFALKTIIIDPGHGGKDPGAISNHKKLQEKDVNLAISKILVKLIKEKMPTLKIVQTRTDDSYITLGQRVEIANQYFKEESLFISIHTNSHNSAKKVEGVEVFYHYISNSTIGNFRNKEMLKAGVNDYKDSLRKGIFQMINAQNKEQSKILAEKVAEGLKLASQEPIRKVAPSNLYVASYSIVPAILVEVGFINNDKLLSDRYKEKVAKGIFLGILKYIKEMKTK